MDTSLDAVAFLDAATGWAVGLDTIVRTNDGGTSWQPQQDAVPPGTRESPDGVLVHYLAVAFVDALHGIVGGGAPFAVGEFGGPSEILVTDDGGKSWVLTPISGTNVALRNSPVNSLCVTAAGVGLASGFGVSGSVVLLSKDAGHTWTEISAVTGACAGRVACAGERDLWVASGSVICHSNDGGASWVDQSRNLPSTTGEIRDITFVDERNGWAVAFNTSAGVVALHTPDGGSSWESHVLPLVPDAVFMTPQAIAVTSSTHTVVVGSKSNAEGDLGPMALVTDDAGTTWYPSTPPSEVIFFEDIALE